MSVKKTIGNKLTRMGPSEVYPQVGEATEKLKAVMPVFGEELVKAIINAVSTGQVRKGELSLNSLTEPKQTLNVVFENSAGSKDISLSLSGDWNKLKDIPVDNPVFCPVKGIIYRKRTPDDEKQIAAEGQFIEPNGAICAISQTKNNIWYLQLPSDIFPKGGILSKFVTPNGREAEKGDIICYIKKVE